MYEFLRETVESNMTRNVRSVAPTMTVGELYLQFAAHDFDAYPVVRGGTLVGVVSKLDALKVFALSQGHILPQYEAGMATTVEEIMTRDVVSVEGDTKLQRVLELMVKHRVRSVPVVAQGGNLRGIIAREDIMRAMQRSTLRQYPPILPLEASY